MRIISLPGILIILIFINMSSSLVAQIYSPGADNSRATDPAYSRQDSIFIFFSTPTVPKTGNLTAIPPFEGEFTFEWSKYNPGINGFDPVFLTHSDMAQSSVTGLEEGGYSVRVRNNADIDTVYTAWVFINELRVEVEKNEQGKLRTVKYTCDFLILNGKVFIDTFFYNDPNTHQRFILPNGYTFLWTSDNPGLVIPNADRILDENVTYQPPYIDTRYFLTVTDSFGMQVADNVLYETIHVKAEFDFEVFDKEDAKVFEPASDPYEAGAPVLVRFINKSINGNSFEWIFSDSISSGFFANKETFDLFYSPEFSYEIPDLYYPELIATSLQGCVDSYKLENPIEVLPSELEVPNVFSPDGDDINQYFKVKHQSIREFSIVIMNRWGKVVYRADVADLYEWEGWDGTVLNTNNPAPPGAYFYVIEARGYDAVRYRRNQYRGTVYLFRGEWAN